MPADESVWFYVKLADGDVERMSLEQLDGRFQAGLIDANTMVLASDDSEWAKLGQLAGLEPELPARRDFAPYSPPPLLSHRPVSVDLGYLDPGQTNGFETSRSPFEDPPRRGRKGKKGWAFALIGLAAACGIGTTAVRQPTWAQPYLGRLGLSMSPQPTVEWGASAPALVSPANQPPTTPPEPPATATPTAPAQAAQAAPSTGDSASVNQASKVAAADKNRHASRSKPHRSKGAPARAHGPTKKTAAPFTTGGNKFDPLNSSI